MITKMCGFGQPKTIYKETTDLQVDEENLQELQEDI